jgi:hypothetical protein
VFDLVEEALRPSLPAREHIDAAQLHLFDGGRWTEHASLALAAAE